MMSEYNQIGIDYKIEYTWLTEKYGRAEFTFCPVFSDGILDKIFIQARQQERKDERWVLDIPYNGIKEIQFNSWSYKTDNPYHWLHCWCEDHNTLMHMIYVPKNTSTLYFSLHFGDHITIQFE
jgi:hypothetical protein